MQDVIAQPTAEMWTRRARVLAGLTIAWNVVEGLVSMGFLWRAKKRAAAALDSRTLEMDAACSLACIQLSAVLFAGSLLYMTLQALWWADGLAALVLSAFIAREGWSGWQAAKREDFAGGCGCS